MRVTITDPHERYPTHEVARAADGAVTTDAVVVDVDDETFQRWEAAFAAFNTAQEELQTLYRLVAAQRAREARRQRALELRLEAQRLEEEVEAETRTGRAAR